MQTTETKRRELARDLMAWFAAQARDLPWRHTTDPYAVWVSEIMLQQTQVKTVVPYWERWMRELPDVAALAAASPARLHKLWEGLGYYTRVRNMQRAGSVIVGRECGGFPEGWAEVYALPGVGRYTAGAICSIAFGQATAVVDGNVVRVLSRVFEVGGNPKDKRVGEQFWALAQTLVETAAGLPTVALHFGPVIAPTSAFNQSLMELGARICLPREPLCAECPVRAHCGARRHNRVADYPALPARVVATPRRFAAFLVREGAKVLAVQRPEGTVNAHLWELPNVELGLAEDGVAQAARRLLGTEPRRLHKAVVIRHSITRYRMSLEVYETEASGVSLAGAQWLSGRQLQEKAFTSAHRKAVDRLTGRAARTGRGAEPELPGLRSA